MFSATRLLWKTDTERMVRLTSAAIRTCRHPAVWQCATVLLIHKDGYDKNPKFKAYHFISLLPVMGK
jgi:hypothetical protein